MSEGRNARLWAIKKAMTVLQDRRNVRIYSTVKGENGEDVPYQELMRMVNEIYKDILYERDGSRVMTLEEVIRHIDRPDAEVRPLYTEYNPPISPEYIRLYRGAKSLRRLVASNPNGYGITWRCWFSDPSDVEREAEKWNRASYS